MKRTAERKPRRLLAPAVSRMYVSGLSRASLVRMRTEARKWADDCRKAARNDRSWKDVADSARKLCRAIEPCLRMAEAAFPEGPKDWFPERPRKRPK